MFSPQTVSAQFDKINVENISLIHTLVASLKPSYVNHLLPAQTTLGEQEGDKIYLIKEGAIRFQSENRVLYFLEQGDIVSVNHSRLFGEYKTDFAVLTDVFLLSDVLKGCGKDLSLLKLWQQIQFNKFTLLTMLISSSYCKSSEIEPDTLMLEPGDILFEQGSTTAEIFTLIEGELDVYVDGLEVSSITQDEIFGTVSGLTETPRSATVKARKFSIVLKLPREHFLDLIKTKPLTILKIIEDFSKRLSPLNAGLIKGI
jgi:CRP/FNR family transcriptional regulator, cyclic AMP receptor protein